MLGYISRMASRCPRPVLPTWQEFIRTPTPFPISPPADHTGARIERTRGAFTEGGTIPGEEMSDNTPRWVGLLGSGKSVRIDPKTVEKNLVPPADILGFSRAALQQLSPPFQVPDCVPWLGTHSGGGGGLVGGLGIPVVRDSPGGAYHNRRLTSYVVLM